MREFSKLQGAIDNKKNGVILARDIAFDNKIIKRYCVFNDYNEIKSTITQTGPQNFYEIFLKDSKCNFFIDEDIEDEAGRKDPILRINNHIHIVRNSLIEFCAIQGKTIILSDITHIILKSPSTEKKDSFHVIFRIKNVYFSDNVICKNFFEYMTINCKEILLGTDKSVYNKNRCLRIIGSSKLEFPDNILQAFEPETLDNIFDSFGTYVEESENDFLLNSVSITKVSKKKLEKKGLPVTESIAVNDNSIRIQDLVDCLDICRVSNQAEFFKFGLLLNCLSRKDNFDYFPIFVEASKKSPKWQDGSLEYVQDMWDSTFNNKDICYSIGTLYYWAKLDNPNKLKNIYTKSDRLDFALNGSHVDVAKSFQLRFGHKFIKNEEDGKWYQFNENTGIWSELPKSQKPLKIALSVLSQEFMDYSNIDKPQKDLVEDDSESYAKAIGAKLKNVSFVNNILDTLDWMMEEKGCKFNNNPYIFPFDNGVYDLENDVFRKGSFEEYSTISCGYSYVKTATTLAINFLKDIFPDQNLYNFMVKVFAGALCGEYKLEEFFIWFNRRGSNGKSTLVNLLKLCFGNFFHSARQEMLLQKSFSGSAENATPGLMSYKNKRYVAYPEVNNQFKLDSNAIKVLTGNENISGRNLHCNETNFKIQARQSLGTNIIPELSQIDGGIVRRLRIIKFETVFTINPTKPYEKLIVDYDKINLRNSMINLFIETYQEFVNNYFIPDCVKTYTDAYLLENDAIRVFCDDQIERDDEAFILKSELKDLFKECKDDYNFGTLKPLALCKKVEINLDVNFKRDHYFNNIHHHDVLLGYKLKNDRQQILIVDDI